jgi:hypothetical protein
MLKKRIIAGAAAAFSIMTISDGAALARCACLDTQDDIAKQAQQRAAIDQLASSSNAAIARQFLSKGLNDDAGEYFKLACEAAQKETTEVGELSLATRAAHAAQLEREAANFFVARRDVKTSASLREQAFNHERLVGGQPDLAQEFTELANLFVAAGDKRKAAFYFDQLAKHLAATRGRYDKSTIAALADYQKFAH